MQTSPVISFKAIPVAKTKTKIRGKISEIKILKLEQSDLPFLKELKDKIDMERLYPDKKGKINLSQWQKTVNEAIENAITNSRNEKYIAMNGKKPCGIMTINPGFFDGKLGLCYIASWCTSLNNQVKNTGKSLMRHYFQRFKELSMVKGEVYPELKSPVNIFEYYEKLFFKSSPVTYWKMEIQKDDVSRSISYLAKEFNYMPLEKARRVNLQKSADTNFYIN